jgi:hypothetical protein
MSNGQAACELLNPVQGLAAAEALYDESLETLGIAAAAVGTAAKLADAPGVLNAVNDLLQSIQTQAPPTVVEALVSAVQIAAVAVASPAIASAMVNFTSAATLVIADAVALVAILTDVAAAAYAACVAAVDAVAAPYFAEVQYLEALISDPPDPNFTVIATPIVASLPPLTAASGLSPQLISDLNSLLSVLAQKIALLQVIPIAMNRVSGAVAAGNAFWQAQQAQAARSYASQLIPLLQNELSLRASISNDFKASGAVFTFSSNSELNTLALLKLKGFPASVTSALAQLGLNTAAQTALLQAVLSTDPAVVAALGNGAFPKSISDPSSVAATNDAVNAFSELAGLATKSVFLIGTDAVSFHRDNIFASQLWAKLGPNVAYINDFGVSGASTVDGQPVTGFPSVPSSLAGFSALFFASPGRCCSDPSADPTLGVKSNTSAISSFLAGGGTIAIENFQGASPWDNILGFPSGSGVVYGSLFPGCSDPGVSTAAGVAAGFIGNGAGPNAYVDGCFVHEAYNDSFFASHGFTSLIDAANLASGSGVVLEEALTPSSGGTQITTATAAVVQANTNGDTVVNLRGLAPTDAPALQDQIQMVVQSRIIQNPSLSAPQLTTQLVNSLPPSLLPPGQAQIIINAVTSGLVPPQVIISGMPSPGCSLWPPNHKLVQVATVTAGDAVGGVLPGSFAVTGVSNEPSNDPSDREIVITPNGSGGYVVQLEADRLGTGKGRIYTLTATAKNSVGATTTTVATCVVPHDQGN